ncbi:MAG: type II secretion system protein N [Sphingobium sp.]
MRDRLGNLRDRLPGRPSGLGAGFRGAGFWATAAAKWMEALLLLLLAWQAARLVWALVTPLGMLGEWQERSPAILPPDARAALFRSFDPFTRGAADAGGAQVTGLALQLFGTRINEGSGQGSAIIATPDGLQSSFIVGDQIMPGVTLREIAYDHVVIDRGGTAETLFLDQSAGDMTDGGAGGGEGGPPPGPAGAGAGAGGAMPSGVLTPMVVQRDIGFAPRSDGGRVSGLVVTRQGTGEGFALAGFQQGDIITQVNGRPITSVGDIQAMQAQLRPGARLSLMVERGAATVPVAIILSGGQ